MQQNNILVSIFSLFTINIDTNEESSSVAVYNDKYFLFFGIKNDNTLLCVNGVNYVRCMIYPLGIPPIHTSSGKNHTPQIIISLSFFK